MTLKTVVVAEVEGGVVDEVDLEARVEVAELGEEDLRTSEMLGLVERCLILSELAKWPYR